MYMTSYEPRNLLKQFRSDLDQFFGNPSNQLDNDSTIATSAWVPPVDIKEEGQQFVIAADIPGVDPNDIEVSMENGVLSIKGERKLISQENSKYYKRVERVYGSFHRRFSLPETADPDKITASGKNGVLKITIPKRAVATPRKITIQT